jgi:hypothetical protein
MALDHPDVVSGVAQRRTLGFLVFLALAIASLSSIIAQVAARGSDIASP